MGRLDTLVEDITKGKLNFLFIGPAGAGKTHAAACLNPPTLFLDTERGLRTVAHLQEVLEPTGSKRIEVPHDRAWAFLMDLMPELLSELRWNCICVDSLTMLSDLIYREIAGQNPSQSDTLKNYGRTIDRLKQFVYKLNTAKAHVIYIAQEAASTNEDGNTVQFVPNVAGKETFARQLPAMVDEVWWFTTRTSFNAASKTRETHRLILTAPSGPRIGKDRDGILQLEEPLDFNALRAKLKL